MPLRQRTFALCVKNGGAEDLEVRKVYRVLALDDAKSRGYLRVIDDSGEDYLYPSDYFVLIELPEKARRAWTDARRTTKRSARPLAATRNR